MKFLFVLIFGFVSTAYASSISHLKMDNWITHTPDVVLCNNINISDNVINEAIERWERRGLHINKVVRKNCNKTPSHGEIAFYIDDSVLGSNAGLAIRTVYTNTNDIAYARVWIRSYHTNSTNLIEHELGHGLGYTDTYSPGTIMSIKGSHH